MQSQIKQQMHFKWIAHWQKCNFKLREIKNKNLNFECSSKNKPKIQIK